MLKAWHKTDLNAASFETSEQLHDGRRRRRLAEVGPLIQYAECLERQDVLDVESWQQFYTLVALLR